MPNKALTVIETFPAVKVFRMALSSVDSLRLSPPPSCLFKTEIAGASYLRGFSFSVKYGWNWSISSKVTTRRAVRDAQTHTHIH